MEVVRSTARYENRAINTSDKLCGRIVEENGIYREEALRHQGLNHYYLQVKTVRESPFRKILGKGIRSWSTHIIILSEEEAKDWVRETLGSKAYEDTFGNPDE